MSNMEKFNFNGILDSKGIIIENKLTEASIEFLYSSGCAESASELKSEYYQRNQNLRRLSDSRDQAPALSSGLSKIFEENKENFKFKPFLDSNGVINKNEVIKLIIEFLHISGYSKSAAKLESESGLAYPSSLFVQLQSRILDGNWDGVLESLNCVAFTSIEDEETRVTAVRLILEQCIIECVLKNDNSSALKYIRDDYSHLGVGKEKLHKLALNLLYKDEFGEINSQVLYSMRVELVMELDHCLPYPITVPIGSLIRLMESAVHAHINSCTYHTYSNSISEIFQNHDKYHFPSQIVQVLREHTKNILCIQFSNHGDYLATASSDCIAIIWQVSEKEKFTLKHKLWGHKSAVAFVSWSPDDKYLLTCGDKDVVKLWDVVTGTCIDTLGEGNFTLNSCGWLPNSEGMYFGSYEYIYEVKLRGRNISKISNADCFSITSNGKNFVCLYGRRKIVIKHFGMKSTTIIAEDADIMSACMFNNGKDLLVNLDNQEIHLWEVNGPLIKPSMKYRGHSQLRNVFHSCIGGLNSNFIACGSIDGKIYIWNRHRSDPITDLCGHQMSVDCVSWNPKRHHLLASGGDDTTVCIWGPTVEEELTDARELNSHKHDDSGDSEDSEDAL